MQKDDLQLGSFLQWMQWDRWVYIYMLKRKKGIFITEIYIFLSFYVN